MKQAAAMTLFPNVFHLFPLSLFLFSFMLILVLLVPSKDNLEALKQVRLVLKIHRHKHPGTHLPCQFVFTNLEKSLVRTEAKSLGSGILASGQIDG